jgi:hypothetical protein
MTIPSDPALWNLPFHVQGLRLGDPGPAPSNALDLIVLIVGP